MKSERDRIQKNANEYIVRNCPCYTSKGDYYDCWANQDTWCENITDCVIKQVIEKCNKYKSIYPVMSSVYIFINEILDMFDIEEINK